MILCNFDKMNDIMMFSLSIESILLSLNSAGQKCLYRLAISMDGNTIVVPMA